MATALSSTDRTVQRTGFNHDAMVQKGILLSFFLFPLLLAIAVIFMLADDEVRRAGYLAWAWYPGLVVMLALANTLKASKPGLAFYATLFCFIGGMTQMSADKVDMEQLMLKDLGFDVEWDTTLDIMPAIGWLGLTVLLWMIGMVMLGRGIWQTGTFSRLSAVLLIVGAISFFLYQGPGEAISEDFPPVAFIVSVISFVIAVPPMGWRLWQKDVQA